MRKPLQLFQVFFILIFSIVGNKADCFDQQSIEQVIREHKVTSIEALLPLLPEDLRSRYVLLWFSRAGQKATFQKPRVIMYSENADFIFAFNDGKMKGGNTIDTISFNHNTFSFDFRRFVFEDNKPTFFPKNEARCQACHEINLRPNWDDYPHWFGAYGMFDDEIRNGKIVLDKIRYEVDADHQTVPIKESSLYFDRDMGLEFEEQDILPENEEQEIRRFNSERKDHPRYKHLISKDPSDLYPFKKYLDRNPSRANLRNHPNANLGALLYSWNIVKSFHLMKNNPNYDKAKFSLLAYFADCSLTEQFVSKMIQTQILPEEGFSLGREELWNYLVQVFGRDVLESYKSLKFKSRIGIKGNDGLVLKNNLRIAYQIASDLAKTTPEFKARAVENYGITIAPVLGNESDACKLVQKHFSL